MSSQGVSKVTFFQAKCSHCLSSSSVLGAGSLYVVSSTIIQMVSRGFTSHEFAGWSSFGIKLANPSDTMLAWSVHRLFLFKAFQLFLLTYPHIVVLETLIDNLKLKVFYLSVLWNCYAYTYSFFDNISHKFCEKTAIHSLVCLLRSPLLTTCSVIVQTSSTILATVFLTEWPADHKNRCLISSTNSVGLHFHEGVEKIKENDKNIKIENLQNEQEKYGGKNLAYVYSWGKN